AIASPVLTTYMWARASRSCTPARAWTLAPTLTRSLRCLAAFRRIDELPDVRSLLIDLRQVLGPEPLIYLQLCLRKFILFGVHVGLAQPVVHVRQVRIQLTRPDVFRNGLGIPGLVRIKIPQLQVGLGQLVIECDRLLQQAFDLLQIHPSILRPLSLP